MQLTKRLHRLLVLGPRGHGKPVDRETWDAQYREGYWDHLSSIHELARYATLAAYTDSLHRGADVLDVGSGGGELLRLLERYSVNEYLGIDLSATAIDLLREMPEDEIRKRNRDLLANVRLFFAAPRQVLGYRPAYDFASGMDLTGAYLRWAYPGAPRGEE